MAPLYTNVDAPPRRPPPQSLLITAARLGLLVDGDLRVTTDDWSSPAGPDPLGPFSESPAQSTDAPAGAVVPSVDEDGVSAQVTGSEDWHRYGGVSYAVSPCAGGGTYDPCDPDPTPSASEHEAPVEVAGFPVKWGTYCSLLDSWTREYMPREAAQELWIRQHYIVAREFWRGEQATASGWPNPYLADASTATTLATGLTTCGALAALEEGLAGTFSDVPDVILGGCGGSLGMIHASPALVHAWLRDFQVVNQGGILYTQIGNIVVTGPGYDGTGPGYSGPDEVEDGESWAYATGLIQARLGPARTHPISQSVDKGINRYTVWAERLAQVSWDQCCHLAVQAVLDTCSTVPGSGQPVV